MQKTLADCSLQLSQDLIWGDMDALGHINNTVYFRFFEDLRMAYITELGMLELAAEINCGPVIASTQCRFKAPLHYPDKITLGSYVSDLQKDRFTMHYLVYSEHLQCVAATGEARVVFYDFNAGTKTDIPESMLEQIRQREVALDA